MYPSTLNPKPIVFWGASRIPNQWVLVVPDSLFGSDVRGAVRHFRFKHRRSYTEKHVSLSSCDKMSCCFCRMSLTRWAKFVRSVSACDRCEDQHASNLESLGLSISRNYHTCSTFGISFKYIHEPSTQTRAAGTCNLGPDCPRHASGKQPGSAPLRTPKRVNSPRQKKNNTLQFTCLTVTFAPSKKVMYLNYGEMYPFCGHKVTLNPKPDTPNPNGVA